jgi:hypothetical protein
VRLVDYEGNIIVVWVKAVRITIFLFYFFNFF